MVLCNATDGVVGRPLADQTRKVSLCLWSPGRVVRELVGEGMGHRCRVHPDIAVDCVAFAADRQSLAASCNTLLDALLRS